MYIGPTGPTVKIRLKMAIRPQVLRIKCEKYKRISEARKDYKTERHG
jgi:hypothetical protein